jgi:hypothetical protein
MMHTDAILFPKNGKYPKKVAGRSLRGSGGWTLVALAALDAFQVDAVEQEREVAGANLLAVFADAGTQGGKGKAAELQAFVKQTQTVRIPVQHFEAITAFGAKHEEVTGEWIAAEVATDEFRERIKRGIFLIPQAA